MTATVEVIQATNRQRAIASVTLAFASDPVMRWAWRDAHGYATYWPRVADAFGGLAFDDGTAYGLEDCLAVALWMRPGVGPDEEAVMDVMPRASTTRSSRTSMACSIRWTSCTRLLMSGISP